MIFLSCLEFQCVRLKWRDNHAKHYRRTGCWAVVYCVCMASNIYFRTWLLNPWNKNGYANFCEIYVNMYMYVSTLWQKLLQIWHASTFTSKICKIVLVQKVTSQVTRTDQKLCVMLHSCTFIITWLKQICSKYSTAMDSTLHTFLKLNMQQKWNLSLQNCMTYYSSVTFSATKLI